jgi:hypothetical protein
MNTEPIKYVVRLCFVDESDGKCFTRYPDARDQPAGIVWSLGDMIARRSRPPRATGSAAAGAAICLGQFTAGREGINLGGSQSVATVEYQGSHPHRQQFPARAFSALDRRDG